MKRTTCSLAGVVMGLSLILTAPLYAQHDSLRRSQVREAASSAASAADLGHRSSNVVFDGKNLSWRVVKDISKDPLVAWGAVRDADGKVTQGEVWMLVAKNDKFIYLHLTDTPNRRNSSIAYRGYTVKIKATMSPQFYSFGFGGAVPIIGNDTDAFVVTTTKVMVNSAFTEGEPQQRNASTGAVIDYLVHLYDVVQSFSQPRASSAGRRTAMQFFAPDGTELSEPFSQHSVASSGSSSSSDCKAVGNDAANDVRSLMSSAQTAWWWGRLPANVLLASGAGSTGGVLGGPAGAVALSGAVSVALIARDEVLNAIGALVTHVAAAAYSALAEGVCEAGSTSDVLPPIELGLHSVDDVTFAEAKPVCDRWETVVVGSTARDDGAGGVEVTGQTERQCVEWHYEVVETKA
jgi:hypothetical protein